VSIFLVLTVSAIALAAIMAAAWETQRRTGQSGWADVYWSFGLGIAGVGAALAPIPGMEGPTERQILVAVLAGIWSLRLGSHIAVRTWRAGTEDPRYAKMRKEMGGDFQRRLFWFLQIQAAAALLLVAAIVLAARNPAPGLGAQDWIGAAVLLAAIVGEAIADRQLRAFAADPANKGKVAETGLWRWSRHPNYFFQWLGWCAYAVIAADFSGDYPQGWLALAGPAFMYWLLRHVSGVPLLEEHMEKSRGQAYRDYQRRVSAFFPLPARRRA
jgi:steroid 5-alpha reductase family enzyme